MTTNPLSIVLVLASCTANAASPEPRARGHACALDSAEDARPHDVLQIASADGSVELLVHAWTDDNGGIVDVHTAWQPSLYAADSPGLPLERADVEVEPIGVDEWRVAIVDGAARHEIRVTADEDGGVLAFASVITGDDEPSWCALRSARLISPRLGRVSLGAARIEARCLDAHGTEVSGWIARLGE